MLFQFFTALASPEETIYHLKEVTYRDFLAMLPTEPHSPQGGKNVTANLPSSSIKNSPYADVTTIVPDLSISHGGMHRRVKAVLDVLCRIPIGVGISLPLLILLFLMEENHTDIQTLIFACINVALLLLWGSMLQNSHLLAFMAIRNSIFLAHK